MMRTKLIVAAAMAAITTAQADCPTPHVSVAAEPLGATLIWTPRAGVVSYFLQYSTGKFPTQLEVVAKPGEMLRADLVNLAPGTTIAVEFCEALDGGRCPAPSSDKVCNHVVEVAVPWSYAGVTQPDPRAAVCALQEGQALGGQSVGYPYETPVAAGTAQDCCQMCAGIGSNLPYQARCTHFVFTASSGECRYLREAGDASPMAGAISGSVRAWPQP